MDRPRDPRPRRRSALIAELRRRLRPPRSLRPTGAGWIFFAVVAAVSFAALNTGNNLLYLVLSLMLAFLVLSGVLSESALRGISVRRRTPLELVVGRSGRVVLEVHNAQRRVPAYAVWIEDWGTPPGFRQRRALGRVLMLRVPAGATERRAYRVVPERRGRLRFASVRVTTRFPFGLFAKSLTLEIAEAVLVYPALETTALPASVVGRRQPGTSRRRGGAESEAAGLREYAPGDPPRRIHWRASWRRGALLVREAESEAGGEAEVRLHTASGSAGPAFERAVGRAASEAATALAAGLRVGLRTDSRRIAPDRGPAQRARLLGYLALVEPERGGSGDADS